MGAGGSAMLINSLAIVASLIANNLGKYTIKLYIRYFIIIYKFYRSKT